MCKAQTTFSSHFSQSFFISAVHMCTVNQHTKNQIRSIIHFMICTLFCALYLSPSPAFCTLQTNVKYVLNFHLSGFAFRYRSAFIFSPFSLFLSSSPFLYHYYSYFYSRRIYFARKLTALYKFVEKTKR